MDKKVPLTATVLLAIALAVTPLLTNFNGLSKEEKINMYVEKRDILIEKRKTAMTYNEYKDYVKALNIEFKEMNGIKLNDITKENLLSKTEEKIKSEGIQEIITNK